jgi:hypothetical protein
VAIRHAVFVESESLLKSWPRGGRTLYTLSRSFVSVLRSHFFGTLKTCARSVARAAD